MVDEFSSFARMPAPVLKPEDLATIVERAVFLERTAHPKIAFETQFEARPVPLRCDARLVGQALINILKNAVELIEGRIAESGPNPPGHIVVIGRGRAAGRDRGRGQRQRLAGARPRAPDRALCHDPREGNRVGPRHREKDHGRSLGRAGPVGSRGRRGSGASWCLPARRRPRPVRSYAEAPAELSTVGHGA